MRPRHLVSLIALLTLIECRSASRPMSTSSLDASAILATAKADIDAANSAGLPLDEIISSYPRLTREAIQACIAYAADLTRSEGARECVGAGS